jgi:hypothetical protein
MKGKTVQQEEEEKQRYIEATRHFLDYINAMMEVGQYQYTYMRQNVKTKVFEKVRVTIFTEQLDDDEAKELKKGAIKIK